MLVRSGGCGGREGSGPTLGESCGLNHLLRLPLLVLRPMSGLASREVHLKQIAKLERLSLFFTRKVHGNQSEPIGVSAKTIVIEQGGRGCFISSV